MVKTVKKTKRTGRKRITFELKAEPGSTVCVSGSFNDWREDDKPLKETDVPGLFRRNLYLAKGTHEYKFVVNGRWCVDPGCPNWAPNGLGSLNSVIEVT